MKEAYDVTTQTAKLEAELRQLRAALAESEAARRLAEATLDETQQLALIGSWVWHIEADRVIWSDQLYRIYGVADRRSRTFDEFLAFLPPARRAEAEPLIRRALEEHTPYVHSVIIPNPGGTTRHIQCRGRVVLDDAGRPVRMVGTVQDVTDRTAIKRELAESESKLRAIVEHATDAISIRDMEGRCLLANPAVASRLGQTPESLIGVRDDEIFDAQTVAAMRATDRQVCEERRPMTYDVRVARQSGEYGMFQVTKYPFLSPEGELLGIISIGRDIAERLERERSKEEQIKRLQELDRLKSDFVTAVSHEFRTPLTSIKGYTEFLLDGIGGPLSAIHQDFAERIEWSTRRLENLVDDLLDFARIEAGTFKLVVAEADLSQKVREVAASFEPQVKEAGLNLKIEVPTTPVVGLFDVRRIGQVIINLISNAIKFTPAGNVTIRLQREDRHLRCEVVDSGVGIAPDDLPKLFQRFSRLENNQTRAVNGTGLGLSISKVIIEGHQGAIGVESIPGAGSTFWFSLPLSQPQPID